ncbi:hypothetical protein DFJ73DRAFT_908912 [Zopfochytrium polystomum]|nr:hypothetical protein DFJ73DRAFT_908912 [Zopfochytrium polystomum]
MAPLDWLLPGFILDQKDAWMFPTLWHTCVSFLPFLALCPESAHHRANTDFMNAFSRLNYLWIVQSTLVVLYSLRIRRWYPAWGLSTKAWPIWQFRLFLFTHIFFYIVEMYATSIRTKYFSMWLHHFFAIFLFLAIAIDFNNLSATTCIPMAMHGYFWASGANDYTFLFFYNVALLTAGVIVYHNNVVCGPCLPTGSLMALLAILISWTNYFTYCYWYRGTVCPSQGPRGRDGAHVVFALWAFAGCIATLVGVFLWARHISLPLFFGVKQHHRGRRPLPPTATDADPESGKAIAKSDPDDDDDPEANANVSVPWFARPPRSIAAAVLARHVPLGPVGAGAAAAPAASDDDDDDEADVEAGAAAAAAPASPAAAAGAREVFARGQVGWTIFSPLHGGVVGFVLGPRFRLWSKRRN